MGSTRADAHVEISAAAAILGDIARHDEPIGSKTTYRVGGRAALFVEIEDDGALSLVCRAVRETGIEVLVIGKGSNLLVAERGFAGLGVCLGESFATLELDTATGSVEAGGSLLYPVMARKTAAAGLGGLEWAVGIPGTVGGAVVMNAGGHGAETADRLVSARVVDLAGGADEEIDVDDLQLSYRHSRLSSSELVVSARFTAEPGADPVACGQLIDEIVTWRREHQPGGRNCGSVFTNPPGDSAGRLIDLAGLKGHRLGTASVSTKHANFIQADVGGSADDIARLIAEIQRLVLERTGTALSTEIRLVGFPP